MRSDSNRQRKALFSSPKWRPVFVAAVTLLLFATAVSARFRQPDAEYQSRRAKLRAALDAPFILYGYTGHEDTSEVALFFQEPYFYYLTGHDEPDAVVVIIPDVQGKSVQGPHEILYLPPRDRDEEQWEGPKLGPDDPGIAETTGFEAVRSTTDLAGDLQKLAKTYPSSYTVMPPAQEDGYPHFTKSVEAIREIVPHENLKDATNQLDAQRLIKSPGELVLMQKAIDLSVDAHLDAMKTMHPGLFEYQIAARMKQIHEWGGCEREAYAPIVGAGFDSTILHYSPLDHEIKDGDVVVIDVGGEYGGYAADITRTLPANGKLTPRQLEIYNIVLGAQQAVIDAIKTGATMYGGPHSLQQIATDYINQSTGRDKEGRTLGRYFIHGISHYIGLDVHDPGDRNLPLQPGMVISAEPGIYIPEENLGVRIEDDVLVTPDGHTVLSERLPRSASEIEQIMSQEKNSN
ncbi:MAG: aminopeptidase P N-terminal domain-containing protein [Candidatus Acidiferrales bacterium]